MEHLTEADKIRLDQDERIQIKCDNTYQGYLNDIRAYAIKNLDTRNYVFRIGYEPCLMIYFIKAFQRDGFTVRCTIINFDENDGYHFEIGWNK